MISSNFYSTVTWQKENCLSINKLEIVRLEVDAARHRRVRMFKITNEMIVANCSHLIFTKGKEYYTNQKIKSINFNQDRMFFEATVLGTRCYDTQIHFSGSGDFHRADCTCPAFERSWGICKHVVAVLLVIRDKDKEGFFEDLLSKQVSKHIFTFFQNRPDLYKTPVNIEITYEFCKGKLTRSSGNMSSISMRIGLEKLYSIKDLKKFFDDLGKSDEIQFGKKFCFDPLRHDFKDDDKPIINLLKELYENEKMLESNSYVAVRGSAFNGKQVLLAQSTTKRFLEIMKHKAFKVKIQEKEYEEVRIFQSDFPVSFNLTKDGKDLLLDIKYEDPLLPLTEEGEYFFSGRSIFKTSQKQQDNFKPFYMALLRQKEKRIRFSEQDKERFVSEVLPFAAKAGLVNIDDNVQSLIEKLDIEPEIFLDRIDGIVSADVKFIYGDRTINPFAPLDKSIQPDERILVRDVDKERIILDILGESEFKVRSDRIFLDEEEKIFDFIFEVVPKLQEHSQVFYSESFKSTILKETAIFSGGIRLNSDTNMLEFSFSADGIERSELADILASFKEKKRYYRLKSGKYIPLNTREVGEISEMSDYLGLRKKDYEKDYIEIPKYRALYLDQHLKDSGLRYIERNHAFKQFVRSIVEPEDTDLTIPTGIEGTLREYQKYGFKWLKTMSSYGLGGILADDMGLGKTLQIITLLLSDKSEKGCKPSIVIAPTSIIYNWSDEVEKFAPSLKAVVITGSKEERHKQMMSIEDSDLVITSYPLIRRDIEEYKAFEFRYCILDEAQHIKNPDSQNARTVKEIRSKGKFALTGTPMENALSELWSIFDFVLPGYLFSYSRFAQKYERPIIKEESMKAMEELGKHIRPFILRRLKSEVLNELPEKIEHKMIAELTEDQKKVYLAWLQKIKSEIESDIKENGFERSHIKILAGLTRLRQICCHPSLFLEDYKGESGKMQLLQEIIEEALDSGHRILLFSQFTSMLRIIRDWLDTCQIDYMYLDGSTKTEERSWMVKAFNNGQGKIFLISLKAGGTGLNLTGADTVIHYDPWWNPAVEDQATDRAYRIGQLKSVHVMKLITRGTIEEKIYSLQDKKKKLIDSVIQPGDTMMSKLTQEEVRALFE